MSHEYAPEDFCPRCGEKLQPMSMFRVDLCRNWNDTKIKSFIICHRCLRNIEEYINTHPDYNRYGFDLSEKRNELLGRAEYQGVESVVYDLNERDKRNTTKTGEWISLKLPITEEAGDIKIICSNCKDEFIGQNDLETWIKVYHFCPSCGAKMKGGAE